MKQYIIPVLITLMALFGAYIEGYTQAKMEDKENHAHCSMKHQGDFSKATICNSKYLWYGEKE